MQYRVDPRTGNKLSTLGFGCMRFPTNALGAINVNAAEELVLDAVERGINYFDTAYLYRGNEEVVGTILAKNNLRDRVYLATKLPHGKCDSFEDFDRYFNEQKARLKTDWFDYYLIHNISDPAQWARLVELGIERWIAGKKESGEIRSIGFSYHGSQSDFARVLDAHDWDFCQIQYNYVNVNYQAGRAGLELAASRGLPVIVMEPLLGGKLSSKLPKKAVETLRKAHADRSPAAWAFSWIWNQPQATVTLSGMNDVAQIEENAALAEKVLPGSMSEQDLAVIDEVVFIFNETNKVNCTGCNYCMPCPQGINIPGCFSAYNTSFAISWFDGVQQYVMTTGALGDHPHFASSCVDCGACVKHCPQNIPIPDALKDVRRRLQPAILPPALKYGAKLLQG